MGNIGDPITTAVPDVNSQGTGYASDINTILTELIARSVVKVPLASLAAGVSGDINSYIDMGNAPLANAQYLGLYTQSAAPSGGPFGRFVRFGGNVYWVDQYGAVQITSGPTLNAAALGGLVGDYGGVNPAKLNYADASPGTYEFYDDQANTLWAYIKFLGAKFVAAAAAKVVTVIAKDPGTTSSYTLILPADKPASGVSLLAFSSTGQLQTAETAAISNPFTVNGGVKHDNHSRCKAPRGWGYTASGSPTEVNGQLQDASIAPYTVKLFFDVPLGRRLKSVSCRVLLPNAGSNTATLTLFKGVGALSTSITLTAGNTYTVNAVDGDVTATVNTPTASVADEAYMAVCAFTGTTGQWRLYNMVVTYDYI